MKIEVTIDNHLTSIDTVEINRKLYCVCWEVRKELLKRIANNYYPKKEEEL